jgi:hypothetical protein
MFELLGIYVVSPNVPPQCVRFKEPEPRQSERSAARARHSGGTPKRPGHGALQRAVCSQPFTACNNHHEYLQQETKPKPSGNRMDAPSGRSTGRTLCWLNLTVRNR